MDINIGDIFWLKTEGEIAHPHVVIKIDEPKHTVCGITTNMKKLNMPGNVLLEVGEGNLEKQSIVEVAKEFQVDKSLLREYIGTLTKERVEQILNGMGFIYRSFINRK